ncbi:5-hydroxytryptamine receptor 1B-like [Dysidea avara]|uniref:5-hydroxytryptamine receptor 1B-like n=1 Tax=Dysidea avara TaxID=196820 RepID=UPI00332B793E
MSAIDYSGSETNQAVDHQGPDLPGFVPYLSLVFKLTITTVVLLLSSWVVYTIKTTRHLHKPQNVFVANLLIAGMITALLDCLLSTTMIISFALGVKFYIGCYIMKPRLAPYYVTNLSLVIIAVDKLIAMTYIKTYPFKYKKIMTPRAVAATIIGAWLISVIPAAWSIMFNVDGVVDVPQYGACFVGGDAFIEGIFIFVIPTLSAAILTITLNIHFAIKLYQVHKRLERETISAGPDSQSDSITVLKKKQHNIRLMKKSIITLLVIVFGSAAIPLIMAPLQIGGRFLVKSQVYQDIVEYVISANIGFVIRIFHPLVYGMYFKQIREPMGRCWRRFVKMNKVNSVAPQP